MTPKHILVGLDGSPLAETVLPFVAELAHRAGSRVTLLNVTHVPEDIAPGGGPGVAEVIERNQGRARDYLREQESRFRQAGSRSRVRWWSVTPRAPSSSTGKRRRPT